MGISLVESLIGNGKTCKQVILSVFATFVLQQTLGFMNFPSCHGKAAVQTALCDSDNTLSAYVTLRN